MLEEDCAGGLSRVDPHPICVGGPSQKGGECRVRRHVRASDERGARRRGGNAPLEMMADVAGFCLNSSAAYLRTALKGAASGTFSLPWPAEQRHR